MNTELLKKITLADFALPQDYQIKPLTYSEVKGKAEILGCYIVVFRAAEKPDEAAAISFDDMLEDKFAQAVGNDMLKRLDLLVKFSDSAETIRRIYGEPSAVNKISEDIQQLHYFVENNTLLNFGLSKKSGLYSLEITNNADIIKERKKRLQTYHSA